MRPWRLQRNALGVFVGGLLLSAWVAQWAGETSRREAEQTIEQAAEVRFLRLRDGLGDYAEILYGIRGFFAGSSDIDRDEFHRYFRTLKVADRHPGLQMVGYARRVPTAGRERFVGEVRADRSVDPAGYPGFAIRPAGSIAESLVIDYVEPMRGNEAAFGFDLTAEPERHAAALRARDSDALAATAPMRLVQETAQQKAFVLMLPIYRNGAPTAGLEDRRRALVGVVHAAFRAQDLIEGVLGKSLDGIALHITDHGLSNPAGSPARAGDAAESARFDAVDESTVAAAQTLLYRAAETSGPLYWREFRLAFAGRHWQVRIGAPAASGGWMGPSAILAGGAVIALLLATLLQSQALARERAEALALRMTGDLRAAAADSQAVLDHTVDAIVTIDEYGRIERFNLAAERLFGRSAGEVAGQNVKLLMPEPYRGEHDGYLKSYRDTGQRKIIGIGRETVGRRADGSTFPIDLAVTEVVVNERRRFIGLMRDITERKRVEQLKSEFVSTVSHELRTPLTSIRGSLGLIEGGVAGPLPAQAMALVGIAAKNCERLVRLINEILDIEKIESGKMRFDLQAQALMPLIDHAVDANQSFAAQHRTRYEIGARVEDAQACVDADRFAQVLTNLLSNAAKYSPPDIPVEVTVRRQDNELRVAVRDRGAGIPREFQDRIFEKFAQADGSTTREKGGSGLGLSIARAMVERMGGRIGFESRAGEGSCFWFCLPEAEPNAPPTSVKRLGEERAESVARPELAPVGVRLRILHVEDDIDLGRFVAALLADLADVAVVPTLADGERALAASAGSAPAARRYDLLILDPGLPDGSGFDLLPTVKALPYTLPVIVFSASEADSNLTEGSEIVAILVKSRTSNERLQQLVRTLAMPARDSLSDKEST